MVLSSESFLRGGDLEIGTVRGKHLTCRSHCDGTEGLLVEFDYSARFCMLGWDGEM